MEDKGKTIKEKLQEEAGTSKKKKLVIKKKPAAKKASPNREAEKRKDLSDLVRSENQSRRDSEQTQPRQERTVKPEREVSDKGGNQSNQPPAFIPPFHKEDSSIIVSRPKKGAPPANRGGAGTGGPQQRGGGGGFQGGRRPGGPPGQRGAGPGRPGPGGRPMGGPGAVPTEGLTPITPGPTGKKKGHDKGKTEEKDRFSSHENSKFFKQNFKKPKQSGSSLASVPKEISIMENVQVGELAKKMNLKPGEVIAKLMKMGMMVTINNVIDSETASILADEYGCKVHIISLYDETVIEEEKDNPEDYTHRPPVVTIMGHVDHGKTKLLDTIRTTTVIDSEAGGITQHIGAYQVHLPGGAITFLDTPGHEAFTAMRARGASITDIVVLVVAANDGVMPQTREAISHAKEAKVPIIVAVNKIDLPEADVEKVLQDLANEGLQAEEWGGDTVVCKISAKQNIGIDKLLEMILIQAELQDFKANPKRRAKGTIIEAKLDPGRGAVATVLIQNGTLRVGDAVVAGVYSGKVRAMYDDLGHTIEEAGPSVPVLVTGLDGVPDAGAPFDSVVDEKEARQFSQHRKEYERVGQAASGPGRVTLDNMNDIIKQGALKELKIIIKADVRGSAEAIKEALEKLSTEDVKLNVIHSGTGAIVDTDVMLAAASNALIVGFNVRANARTITLAEKESVTVKYYNIIYDIVNEIKSAMEGLLDPEKVEEVIGQLEVRDTFKISKVGTVAGCMVTSGKVTKSSQVRVLRDSVVIFDGKLRSLKRGKDDTNEVMSGFECGLMIDGFNDFTVGDEIEVYQVSTQQRKL